MQLVHFFLLVGATQVAAYKLVVNETHLEIFQNQDDRFLDPYLIWVNTFGLNSESTMDTITLIQHRGYPVEVHTVTTDDDYILTMHRIPYGKNGSADPNLSPILLIHGTFGFADHFLISLPKNSFAYLLADAGFDVWVGNMRGTEHSHLHKTLSARDPRYWEFSWDQIAEFDLPAFVDRMLNVTGRQQVFLSGHSLGGGVLFAMLASRPEYIPKVKAVFALAPVGNMEGFSPVVKTIAPLTPIVQAICNLLGIHELLKISPILMGYLGKYFEPAVKAYVFMLVGSDKAQWDAKRCEMNQAHLFSSMAMNVYYHLMQMVTKNGFRKFDWGKQKNQQKYGQPYPPDYDISNITVPSHLYFAQKDLFCTKGNVQYLVDRLPNAVLHEAGTGWNHADFVWGKYAGKSFYNCLIPFIKRI